MSQSEYVTVIGGGGYVGSALVPALLDQDYQVKVIDLFMYGQQVFDSVKDHPNLKLVTGDIRDPHLLNFELADTMALIHLACISNDSSFDLNPALGKSINYDAFFHILNALENSPVRRFIYASSSSVYGLREEPDVTEDSRLTPLTDYSKYKLLCEEALQQWQHKPDELDWVIIRPATVCGYAPRLRLDLTVNILTIHALVNNRIRVLGGKQLRPNIHIQDMVRAYLTLLEIDRSLISGNVFNAGYQNESVENIAHTVRTVLGTDRAEIVFEPTDDLRSYHVNSDKIRRDLGFETAYTLEDAVDGIRDAYDRGLIIDGLNNEYYHNIKRMQNINLK
jgi:nucleoside-diphosphate-sugar epimerase